jgi:mxaJ protein
MSMIAAITALLALATGPAAGAGPRDDPTTALRVCADPNALPYSNARGEGFEIAIARVLARELRRPLQLVYVPLRRGFVRNTLGADRCDALMGVPSELERVLATRPYYRSTYVFASRRDRGLSVSSLDDPALKKLRVGVELVGDDGANPPAAHALAARGIVDNVVGFTVYGDYRDPAPAAEIVRALQRGALDLAIVWGPRAGFFGRRGPPLRIAPVAPSRDRGLPFAFDVSVGVRRGDRALRDALDGALARRRSEIGRILDAYGVPRAPPEPAAGGTR